jgi:hypothetical protein
MRSKQDIEQPTVASSSSSVSSLSESPNLRPRSFLDLDEAQGQTTVTGRNKPTTHGEVFGLDRSLDWPVSDSLPRLGRTGVLWASSETWSSAKSTSSEPAPGGCLEGREPGL